MSSAPVVSSGSKLLVEFFSDELLAGGQECWGGFLAHAHQTPIPFSNISSITPGFSISKILRNMDVAPTASTSSFLMHSFIGLFAVVVIFVSGCLGIQYILRYRKYQLAAAAEDAESTNGSYSTIDPSLYFDHTDIKKVFPFVSDDSQANLAAARIWTKSNSTLLSEVISLQRFKPSNKYKHSRLREEEPDVEEEEQISESSESQQ